MDRDMVSNRKQEIDRLVSCFGAGDLAQAEKIARRLLAADRQDEEALHLLAQICYRRGRAEESVTLMKELLGLNPAHAPYNNDYGVMLASLGRWDEAATAYGVAVVLDQRNVDEFERGDLVGRNVERFEKIHCCRIEGRREHMQPMRAGALEKRVVPFPRRRRLLVKLMQGPPVP